MERSVWWRRDWWVQLNLKKQRRNDNKPQKGYLQLGNWRIQNRKYLHFVQKIFYNRRHCGIELAALQIRWSKKQIVCCLMKTVCRFHWNAQCVLIIAMKQCMIHMLHVFWNESSENHLRKVHALIIVCVPPSRLAWDEPSDRCLTCIFAQRF